MHDHAQIIAIDIEFAAHHVFVLFVELDAAKDQTVAFGQLREDTGDEFAAFGGNHLAFGGEARVVQVPISGVAETTAGRADRRSAKAPETEVAQ